MSSPSKKSYQNEVNEIKALLQCSMSSAYCRKRGFFKTWTFDFSSPQYRGKLVYQTMQCSKKKINKALIQKLVEWIMKNPNVSESPIARDNLIIIDA